MALKVAKPQPQPKITVAKPTPQPKLKVGYNYGMQVGYNPQNAAAGTTIQNAGGGKIIQNAAGHHVLQRGHSANIQPAATAAQIQAAVQAARIAAEQEAARQRAIVRARVQGEVNQKVDQNKSALKLKVGKAPSPARLSLGRAPSYTIKLPEQSEYDKEYAKAYREALKDFEKQRDPGKKNIFQKAWDKVSFGQDRRDTGAREYAKKRAEQIMDKNFKAYEKKILSYNEEKARAQERINKALTTMTQSEFDAYFAKEQAAMDKRYSSLEKEGARYDAQVAAYGGSSQRELTSFTAKALRTTKNVASVPGKFIWRSTLGEGWENMPSVVTAPTRIANWVGNINTNDRTIYKHDQTTMNRTKTGKNAWQATYNQRDGNHRPYIDKPFDKAAAQKLIKKDVLLSNKYKLAKNDKEREDLEKRAWDNFNRQNRNQNTAQMLAKDPLTYAAGVGLIGKVGKGSKVGSKLITATKTSKPGQWTARGVSAMKNNKVSKWLTSEHKTHINRVSDEIGKELDDIAMKNPQVKKLVNNWQQHKGEIKTRAKFEEFKKVSDDFLSLSKQEVAAFQRYVRAGGDWTKVKKFEKLTDAQKANIEKLGTKYRGLLDDMQKAERKRKVLTPYRKNYLPQYQGKFSLSVKKKARKFMGDDGWWFTKQQKKQKVQSKDKFMKSLTARSYDSRVARKDLPVLRDIVAGREDIGRNIDRIENMHKFVKKTKWERGMDIAGAPVRAWKKAVLLGNPAWYVNNEIFNQIQGGIAGGMKFFKNQRGTKKYLEHIKTNAGKRMLPSETRKMVTDISSDITKEVGGSKLGRLASKQEGRARIALYRTYRQRGLSHDAAVKKMNRSLFSYKTANWERPLKTLVPFWSWQKGLAKAGARMPFEHPVAARGFNNLDRYQDKRMDDHFDQAVPELKKMGYTDAEIEEFRKESRKYNKGKFRIGDTYFNTPFNAFSERGMDALGINPYIAAGAEVAGSTDFYGQKVQGFESSFIRRIASKFPQLELGIQGKRALDVSRGTKKPLERWRGGKGSDGIGYGKEKQGYDPSKANYVPSMDPRRNLGQNALAFLGVPRRTTVDMDDVVERKRLGKVTDEYFKVDWKSMKWEDQEKGQAALFKKYGITADQFYKGILSKYDTETTAKVKSQKEEARKLNNSLLEEYGRQPQGTRSRWAVNKLRELNESGYYSKNPFLYRFEWMTPTTVAKADKSSAYLKAKNTGNWLEYNRKYGDNRSQKAKDYETAKRTGNWDGYQKKYGVKSQKARDYKEAKRTGNWTEYTKKYGQKETPFKFDGKFFKSKESMEKYKSGKFWRDYAKASKADRRKMLAENPQYDTRSDWTAAQWSAWRAQDKAETKAKARGFGNFAAIMDQAVVSNKKAASTFIRSRKGNQKKVVWRFAK